MIKADDRFRRGALAVLLALAAGCATQPPVPPGHPPVGKVPRGASGHEGAATAWPLAVLGAVEGARVGLPVGSGVRWFDAAALRAAWQAAQRVEAVTPGARPQYLLVEDATANAFALRGAQGETIGINTGMVELLGADEPAWAALIGHELAHLNLRHSEQRRSRQNETGGMVALASIVLTAVAFPLTPLFAEFATSFTEKGYSRDDERAADEAGIASMRRAGYDPEGAVRFFEKLGGRAQSPRFAFLSTHPDSAERVAAARALADR
ncbi:MAG TPA: M48 family metallopeptidase [Aromatoleum sp.]|uniref:M48 family metallopeptidase n=1 Tax=Aromatoleum sp. TaxID=2307007 RepID=UPI002B48340C|nr:M48 family metallopeptidase [Aromatoleum sp.]HJV26078.1 M48 family metallopeptidase [Aromatoleum sp.]